MSHTTATSDEITGWFAGRLTDGWFTAAPEITIDREEILVVGPLADVDLPADASDAARAAAGQPQPPGGSHVRRRSVPPFGPPRRRRARRGGARSTRPRARPRA